MQSPPPQDAIRSFPDLKSERLLLRRLRLDDAGDIFDYARDPQMTPFVFWEPHRTVADTLDFLQRTIKGYEDGLPPVWGIQHVADDRIVGAIAIHDVSWMHLRAEIGYALARKYWRQGLMTEAVRRVLGYCFDALGLNRVEARCDVDNTGSWRVMEKCGMKFEGVLRQNIILHGRPRDARMHAILREDWAIARQK